MNVTEKAFHEFLPLSKENRPTLDWYMALAKHIDQVKYSSPVLNIFRHKLNGAVYSEKMHDAGCDEDTVLVMLYGYLIGNHEMLTDLGILSRAFWKDGFGAKIITPYFVEVTQWFDNAMGPLTSGNTFDDKCHYVEYRALSGARIKWYYSVDGADVVNITYETSNGCDLYVIMMIDENKYAIRKNNKPFFVLDSKDQTCVKMTIRAIRRCEPMSESEEHHTLAKILPAFFSTVPELN